MACGISPADFHILFVDIIRLLLMVPIYSWISFASYLFWVRFLVSVSFCRALTSVMKFPRITPHPCFSSATHTRPSSSPLFSIFYSRIYPRIQKCRKPSSANTVCQRRTTRNADGVGSPEGSGSSLSDLSGGNRRCGRFLLHFSVHAKHNEPSGWSVLFAAYEVGCTSVLRHPAYVRHTTNNPFFLSLAILMAGPHSPL